MSERGVLVWGRQGADVLGARRFQQLEKLSALDQHFALSSDAEGAQFTLANVGTNAGLTELQVRSSLFDSQQISGFGIHPCLVLSLVADGRGWYRVSDFSQYILIASHCQQTLKILFAFLCVMFLTENADYDKITMSSPELREL